MKKKKKSDAELDKIKATLSDNPSSKEITSFLMQAMEMDIREAVAKRHIPGTQLRPFVNVVSADVTNGYDKEEFTESLSTTRTLELSTIPKSHNEKLNLFREIGKDYNANFPGHLPVAIYFVSEVFAKVIEIPDGKTAEDIPMEEVTNLKGDKEAKDAIMVAGLSVDKQLRISLIPLEEVASDTDIFVYEPQVFDLNNMKQAETAGVPMLSAFFEGISLALHGNSESQDRIRSLQNFLKMSIN